MRLSDTGLRHGRLPGDNLQVRLFAADVRRIGVEWNTANVRSSFWRFYRNSDDGAALELGDSLYPLRGGQLYFVPAGVGFSCRNTRSLEHFYVHFDVVGLPSVAVGALFASPLCVSPAPALEEAVTTLQAQLADASTVDMERQCRIKSLLYEGVARCFQTVPSEKMEYYGRLTAAHEPVLPALRHIEANLSARMTNCELAALCHLSEDYFNHRFRECVGQSPVRYIQERRILRASQQLLFTEDSIDRIAGESGFGNRFYFSRIFTRLVGISPAAYRKTSRI